MPWPVPAICWECQRSLTTALSAGSNGPQLADLGELFAGQPIIDRTLINAWKEPRIKEAILATGRKQVIIAGTGFIQRG